MNKSSQQGLTLLELMVALVLGLLIVAVGACFDGLGIPYNMQHSDYTVGGQPKLVS